MFEDEKNISVNPITGEIAGEDVSKYVEVSNHLLFWIHRKKNNLSFFKPVTVFDNISIFSYSPFLLTVLDFFEIDYCVYENIEEIFEEHFKK